MSSLTICIVTKNEEHNIELALKSVLFADEIIVVDSYSSDKTVALCKQYTDKIYFNTWQGCGVQKKFALDLATKEWVLILDADERLSVELQQEIKDIIKINSCEFIGYKILFQSFCLGQSVKYGICHNERHLRLFRRNQIDVVPKLVHFGLKIINKKNNNKIGNLQHCIRHYSYADLEVMLNKMNLYSSLGAKEQYNNGKKASIFTAIFHGLFAFIKGYIIKLGFLDGKYGFMLAVAQAEGAYYKYIKLNILHVKNLNTVI